MSPTATSTDFYALATDYLNQVYANLKHNNVNLPLLIWLSAQARLLEYHKGKQEVLPHVWLQGRAEIGKSYAMNRALELLPEGTVETYQGASPKRFPRDPADIRHRVVFFEEADSLAQGEENAMAESFRLAMDSGDFVYKTQDRSGGGWQPRDFRRQGPFIIWSTSLQSPGTQLASRMAVVSLPEPDAKAIAERNLVKRQIERNGWPKVPTELIAHQMDLQKQAVASGGIRVSFNDEAYELIGKLGGMRIDPRAYSHVLFLLKALALMDERTEVIANDYDTLYDLNAHSEFLASGLNSGITGGIRRIAQAVANIKTAEAEAAKERFEREHPDPFAPISIGQYGTMTYQEGLIGAVRNAWHSKITNNILAHAVGLRPTQTQVLLKAAAAEGWVENVGGTNKAKTDWALGPQFKPVMAGLPSRWALLGKNEDGSEPVF
jgi:uncharacterized protein YciI